MDVMVVLDRSNNYNAATWNKVVIPTLKSIVDGVGPSGATNTRLGVVLYPAANGNPGDHSGGARTLIGLSRERFTVVGLGTVGCGYAIPSFHDAAARTQVTVLTCSG